MITGIDHVIILVDGLPEAVRAYAALGFDVTPGGEHPGWGTENALIALADGSYLELLAARDRTLAAGHPLWRRLDGSMREPGEYGGFMLGSSALAGDVDVLRSRGVDFNGPQAGARLRPDGQEVRWRLAFPKRRELPALIEDVTPRSLRIPPPADGIGRSVHIEQIAVGVSDLAAAGPAYAALLDGGEPPPGPEGSRGLVFRAHSAQIAVFEPPPDSQAGRQVKRSGPGVHSIVLRIVGRPDAWTALGAALQGEGVTRPIDPARTCGARIHVHAPNADSSPPAFRGG